MSDKLIEELIEKLRGHIRWHVEADVLACDMTDRELRDIIVAGVMPIIQRREIEAGEKVKVEAKEVIITGLGLTNTRMLEKMRALDVAAIIGGKP